MGEHLDIAAVQPWEGADLNIGGLRVPVPIIQGGMGVGVSLSGLASAVARAGGIGVISAALIGPLREKYRALGHAGDMAALEEEIATAKRLSAGSPGAIGVNIMVAGKRFHELVDASIRAKVDVIISGAGLPLDLPSHAVPGMATKLVPIVSSAKAARLIAKRWIEKYNYTPDAFVVEGPLAGGHLGFKAEQVTDPAFAVDNLVAEVRQVANDIQGERGVRPAVLAAGGVFTGEDIAHMVECGADGVQMATRFIATEECDASQAFKDALIGATDADVTLIPSPVGMPGRALASEFVSQVKAGERTAKVCRYDCLTPCQGVGAVYCIAQALINAVGGDLENGYVFVGGSAGRVREMTTVPALIDELREGYLSARLNRPAALA